MVSIILPFILAEKIRLFSRLSYSALKRQICWLSASRRLKAVALDSVRDLDARIYPFIGYALEGFIVASYLQWRAKSEGVNVVPQCSLESDNGSLSLGVYPITADFKIGGTRLHSLVHFNNHQKHSNYLIFAHSGDYVEIGLITDNSLLGILDFNQLTTFGAKECSVPVLQPLVTAFHAGTHSGFEAIAIVLDGGVERPRLLWN